LRVTVEADQAMRFQLRDGPGQAEFLDITGMGEQTCRRSLRFLAERKIAPVIAKVFPLERARQALERLATGTVAGKIVLRCD